MDRFDEFEFDSYESYFYKKAELTRTPVQGTFELLPYCNMSCRMCYIRQTPTKERLEALKRPEFWLDKIRQGIDEGLLYVLLTGGEITLYPWFREFYEELASLPVFITLNTNGTLWDEEFVAWLAKRPPKIVNITLYGTDNDTYGSLCHNPHGFDQVTHTMDLLRAYGIQFRIHVSVVPENVDQLDRFVQVGNHYGCTLSLVSYMFPSYRKDGQIGDNNDRLTPEQAANIKFQCNKLSYYGRPEAWHKWLTDQIYNMDHMSEWSLYGHTCMDCRAGETSFWVDWQGRMSCCGLMVPEKIDLAEHTFHEAWTGVKEHVDHIHMPLTCMTCYRKPVCPMCTAAAFCETGYTDHVPSPYCCKYAEETERLIRLELESE